MTVDIPSLVGAAGGEIVGKVRLQKIMYLLDQIGLRSGFSFEYRHYGPYSADLAEQIEDDVAFGHLKEETRRRQSDGVPYTVYKMTAAGDGEKIDTSISVDQITFALEKMQEHSSTVLELAATIHWLAEVEGYEDWRTELVRRKGAKTQAGRDEKALRLLHLLHLTPAT
jgi:uncharacterized protein YwgA